MAGHNAVVWRRLRSTGGLSEPPLSWLSGVFDLSNTWRHNGERCLRIDRKHPGAVLPGTKARLVWDFAPPEEVDSRMELGVLPDGRLCAPKDRKPERQALVLDDFPGEAVPLAVPGFPPRSGWIGPALGPGGLGDRVPAPRGAGRQGEAIPSLRDRPPDRAGAQCRCRRPRRAISPLAPTRLRTKPASSAPFGCLIPCSRTRLPLRSSGAPDEEARDGLRGVSGTGVKAEVPARRGARGRRAGAARPPRRPRGSRRGEAGYGRDPPLPARRPVAARNLRPQAGRPRGVPQHLPPDPHPGARDGDLRAVPAPGEDRRTGSPSCAPSNHDVNIHSDGGIVVLTGKRPTVLDPTSQSKSEHPDFGSIASKVRGTGATAIPPYVTIPQGPYMTRPTYLGRTRGVRGPRPVRPDYRPAQLALSGRDVRSLENRRRLLERVDRFRTECEPGGKLGSTDRFRAQAFELLTSAEVASAFDLAREPRSCATATAGTSGARAACWPGDSPRRGPRSSRCSSTRRRAGRSSRTGTTTL